MRVGDITALQDIWTVDCWCVVMATYGEKERVRVVMDTKQLAETPCPFKTTKCEETKNVKGADNIKVRSSEDTISKIRTKRNKLSVK